MVDAVLVDAVNTTNEINLQITSENCMPAVR